MTRGERGKGSRIIR